MWKLSYKTQIPGALRANIEDAYETLLTRTDLGFMRPDLMDRAVESIRSLVSEDSKPEHIVVVGIGGSTLGTQALCQAIFPEIWQSKITFLDNVDALTLENQLAQMATPESYQWILVSKSGGTIEPLTIYDFCHQYFRKSFRFDIAQKTIVISENKSSPLFDFAQEKSLPFLELPRSIGGRFSVFTPVGLLPLYLLGAPVDEIVKGAQTGLCDEEMVLDLASEMLVSLTKSELNFYMFSYCDRLTYWTSWLQQLWAESLAKHLKRDGELAPVMSTMIPCRGASDQHSILQQMAEGREKKFVLFVRDGKSEGGASTLERSNFSTEIMVGKRLGELLAAEVNATADALLEKGVRSVTLQSDVVGPRSIAHLMSVWMMVVGTLGEALNINAYNQPGVESGKELARRVLAGSD